MLGLRAAKRTSMKQILATEKNLLVDPCKDEPTKHFTYERTGRIKARSEMGHVTINILKLNRPSLVRSRKKAIERLLQFYVRIGGREKQFEMKFDELLAYAYSPKCKHPGISRFFALKWAANDMDYLDGKTKRFVQKELVKQGDMPVRKRRARVATSVELTKHIYFNSLRIRNFKCFKELEITFPENEQTLQTKDGRAKEPWLLFLGENGVGKSSLLKAIALCLMTEAYRKKLGIKAIDLLRNNTKSGFIELKLKGSEKKISLEFFANGKFKSSGHTSVNLVGYGATRVLPKKPLDKEKGKSYPVKVQNLFDYTIALNNAKDWLLGLTNSQFKDVALALKDLLLLEGDAKVTRLQKRIWIVKDGQRVSLEHLSDGYQTVLALAVDIMSTLIHDQHSFDSAEGVVLVDEIGTHLHPRWKMRVVECLRNTFPKIQFIVTTHEPLCLRGLVKGEIVLLTNDASNNVHAICDLPDPSHLRIDELLTSGFFGLNSTLDPDTEKDFRDYYSLLIKPKLTKDERVQKLGLEARLPRYGRIGRDEREDLVYHLVDQVLARRTWSDSVDDLKEKAVAKLRTTKTKTSTKR